MKVKMRDLRLTNLVEIPKIDGGVSWSAVLTKEGKPFIKIVNRGRGGCNKYEPIGMTNRELQPILKELELEAAKRLGYTIEAFDHFCCKAKEGDFLV